MIVAKKRKNLGIVATHPIQYHAPWFRYLSTNSKICVKVYYIFMPDDRQQGKGFGHAFQWDIPLLDGYDWTVMKSRVNNDSLGLFGKWIYQFSDQLRADRIDICLITGWQALGLLQALFLCRRLGIKVLVRGESNSIHPRSRWKRGLHRMLLRRYDGFLAIGKENEKFYIDNGVDAERIFWCPYFVDNERFAKQAENTRYRRGEIRRRWRIEDDKVCFLFAGKFERKKRLTDLIKAIDIARRKTKSVHLLIVGSGEESGQIRDLIERSSIPVSFSGFLNQTEISNAYIAADCLVLPSDHGETWGLVVNEAMASGLPAIVSDRVGCGPDLVIPDHTGLTFEYGDVQDMAQIMIRTAREPEILKRMGRNAQQHIQNYTIPIATQGLLQAMDAVSD